MVLEAIFSDKWIKGGARIWLNFQSANTIDPVESTWKFILFLNFKKRKLKLRKMLCTSPPPPPASPAGSEISVGAPSPPPSHQRQSPIEPHTPIQLQNERRRGGIGGDDYFRPLKRLRGITNASRERSTSPPPPLPPPTRSSIEGVKSFSIADILGHDATGGTNNNSLTTTNGSPSTLHHQLNGKIVRPWDHLRGPVQAVRPFLPPALLHYEHRLAIDYHRHLEHLNAQAQLLRHMNMTMDMKSESGSERSSSAASDCCSPEIGSSGSRLSEHHMHHSSGQHQQSSPAQHHHSSGNGQKTKPNGTPLDALFQMTNKSFDESQGDNDTGIFDVVWLACCILHCITKMHFCISIRVIATNCVDSVAGQKRSFSRILHFIFDFNALISTKWLPHEQHTIVTSGHGDDLSVRIELIVPLTTRSTTTIITTNDNSRHYSTFPSMRARSRAIN